MTERKINGKRVAFLATDGVEQVELTGPREALEAAGARTTLIAPKAGRIRGWNHDEKGDEFPVDVALDAARVEDFDALVLPGGVMNPDVLRQDARAVALVRDFFRSGKPVAAICHGPWLLVEADVVRGRTLTSWPSLRTDLVNAGADWVDREVVADEGLVTSRNPGDIPAFSAKVIEEIAEGVHEREERRAPAPRESGAESR